MAGFVECPVCGDTSVTRALMAPAIPKKGRAARRAEAPATESAPTSPAPPAPMPPQAALAGPLPAHVLVLLRQMRAEVERTCDYVGRDFAEEARRQATGESERTRGIYGEATPDEAEALADQGIEVGRIPWVPLTDS
jgi:hypothetical protein